MIAASNSAVRATSAFPASMTIRDESVSMKASPPVVIEAGAGITRGVVSTGCCAEGGAATGPEGVHAANDPALRMSKANRGTARVGRVTGDLLVDGKEMVGPSRILRKATGDSAGV